MDVKKFKSISRKPASNAAFWIIDVSRKSIKFMPPCKSIVAA
jgi:hypothetical protein